MEERNFIPVKRRTKSCRKRQQQQVEPHRLKSTSHSSASTSTQTDPLSMIKTVQLDRKKMIPKKPRSVKSKAKQVRTFSFSLMFFVLV
uniref:Putative ovule protein n=1 Tax=Solanum chacoense TaxID=4108 RepID=A0A0V0HB02_SOLCH